LDKLQQIKEKSKIKTKKQKFPRISATNDMKKFSFTPVVSVFGGTTGQAKYGSRLR